MFFSNVIATIIAIYQTNPSLTVPNISLRVNIKIVQSHVYYSQTNEWKIGSWRYNRVSQAVCYIVHVIPEEQQSCSDDLNRYYNVESENKYVKRVHAFPSSNSQQCWPPNCRTGWRKPHGPAELYERAWEIMFEPLSAKD